MSSDSDRSTDVLPDLSASTGSGAFRVVIVAGPDKGKSLLLGEGTRVVGAGADADLLLNDRGVSRRHLALTVTGDRVSVEDLGSTNGTFHLGQRIERASVGDGTRLELGTTTLELNRESAKQAAISSTTRYGELVGESLPMRRLFTMLERVEKLDVPILLIAETGTGKELVARALHDRGPRRDAPFVVFDCGAVAPELVESELFGHVKGSFTGAQGDRAGVFEQANGGTLLLDEIGELPLGMQTRLLRALERSEVKRLGSNDYRKVDVRVIAATHRDLEEASNAGTFRKDLYYRLAVVKVGVPPLAQRREDIPRLANHFAELFGQPPLSASAVNRLVARDWPGNVRELRNAVQRMIALGEAEVVEAPASSDTSYKAERERIVEAFEERYVRSLLERHDGNVTAAAKEAQISRKHLYELIHKHGL